MGILKVNSVFYKFNFQVDLIKENKAKERQINSEEVKNAKNISNNNLPDIKASTPNSIERVSVKCSSAKFSFL